LRRWIRPFSRIGQAPSEAAISSMLHAQSANSASCTLTTFSYTTTHRVQLSGFGDRTQGQPEPWWLVNPTPQAMDPSVLESASTYISSISTDIDGTVMTTTRCDVFLNQHAIVNLQPAPTEARLLSECVDPRRWLCEEAIASTSGCKTDTTQYLEMQRVLRVLWRHNADLETKRTSLVSGPHQAGFRQTLPYRGLPLTSSICT